MQTVCSYIHIVQDVYFTMFYYISYMQECIVSILQLWICIHLLIFRAWYVWSILYALPKYFAIEFVGIYIYIYTHTNTIAPLSTHQLRLSEYLTTFIIIGLCKMFSFSFLVFVCASLTLFLFFLIYSSRPFLFLLHTLCHTQFLLSRRLSRRRRNGI